jgi:anti-sigma factor RsiW
MARRETILSCRRVEVLLEAYLDGALASGRRAAVQAHLATCFVCGQELEHARRVRGALRDLPERFCDDAVVQRALERVRGEVRTPATASLGERWRRFVTQRLAPAWQPAAGLALVLVLGLGVRHWVLRPRPGTFTPQDVARAEMQVKWVLAHLGKINEQTANVVAKDVLDQNVAEPIARAVGTALAPVPASADEKPSAETRLR